MRSPASRLVFPLSMLMLQMSAGGIGGASTAAVARALGAGRSDDASRLAQHALFIAFVMAALFMAVMLGFGRAVFGAMGGRGAALDAALAYSNVLFTGAIVIWSTNVLAAVVRGAGNMLLPSLMLLTTALIHLVLCPVLVFGWGPVGGLGIAGAAVSTLTANAVAAIVMAVYLLRRNGAVQLQRSPWRLRIDLLRDILRVGVPASLSPMISNASIAVATAVVGSFGVAALAGYGVAARLEYILVPIAFGFGTALTTMVATNMGAGQAARALRVAWIGGAVVAAITGAIGVTAAIAPSALDESFHRRHRGAELRRELPEHRRRVLRTVRAGARVVLRVARSGTNVLAFGRQRGTARHCRGGRMGLRLSVKHVRERVFRCCCGEPGRLCDDDCGRYKAWGLEEVTAAPGHRRDPGSTIASACSAGQCLRGRVISMREIDAGVRARELFKRARASILGQFRCWYNTGCGRIDRRP